MMCLMSVYFIKVPYEMLRDAVRELLMMSPDKAICDKVNESVKATVLDSNQQMKLAGVAKVGRELRVNVSIHPDSQRVIAVDDIERTRRSLTRRLSALPFELQLNLSIAA
jgi:predicted Co/Zn/Cd cation transporter (cation efflux family)